MATAKQASRVKCLNKSPGITGKRFTFKTFRERVEDIEIDVFRSLQPVKLEPAEGSTFFRDALLHWRELNTAEDFISFYEEMMPIAQTLPQILLHKERIFSGLLSRLRMDCRLSLEPILGLFASLSRDLLKEFIPLLPRLVASLVYVLKSGGDLDSEVLEQVFTSWSYVIMYLQKYLVSSTVKMLKITTDLRYYPKDHIQEFMGEAMSFLMRNTPFDQLQKGISFIIDEVARKSTPVRKTGAIVLLWHVIRGTSSRLHSKAEEVIASLANNSILSSQDNSGSDAVVTVICGVLQRFCKESRSEELSSAWKILFNTIFSLWSTWEACGGGGSLLHISRVLSILVSTLQQKNRDLSVADCQLFINFATFLVEKYIVPYKEIYSGDNSLELLNMALQLMLCLLNFPSIYNNVSVLSDISVHWAPIFNLGSSSLVTFIKQLLSKENNVIHAFKLHIFSAMDMLIDSCPEEVLYLIITCYDKDIKHVSDAPGDSSGVMFPGITRFLKEKLYDVCNMINGIAKEEKGSLLKVPYSELVTIWGVLRCYHHFCDKYGGSSVIRGLIYALDNILGTDNDMIVGIFRPSWQGLLAAALTLYHKQITGTEVMLPEVVMFLDIAKRNKSSGQILFSVAEFLDSALGSHNEATTRNELSIFDMEHIGEVISDFCDNLAVSDKAVRLATLRILSHCASFDCKQMPSNENQHKKLHSERSLLDGLQQNNVIELFLSIESTPISVSTSRMIIISISRIEAELNAVKIPEAYIPLVSCGFIGIFHNRFTHLWEPTIDGFKVLFSKYKDLPFSIFFRYLENYQSQFLRGRTIGLLDPEDQDQTDLGKCFSSFLTTDSNSTPAASVLSLLLQTLQKVPDVSESHSWQLVPLFLKFLGYSEDTSASVEVFSTHQCSKKEWKPVLLEWLNLLYLMHNSCSLQNNKFVKEVLINRLLDEADSMIQLKVLECLFNWRDEFLLPYRDHLKNLIDQKNLREELTTWSLSKDSNCIGESHRPYLIPLIIHILVPKVRSVKTLASRRHAGLNQRKAVLCFLAQLAVEELDFFFTLLFKHLSSKPRVLVGPGTCTAKGNLQLSMLVSCSLSTHIDELSLKKSTAFLHVLNDILRTFDESHLCPFLNPLLFMVVRILERCSLNLDRGHDGTCYGEHKFGSGLKTGESEAVSIDSLIAVSKKQSKDLRSLCLKIISFVLDKYQDHDLDIEFWDIFFRSIKPLMVTFKQETASSEKPSSLLNCFLAMSRSSKFTSLLDRDVDLLPSIFSILTVSRTSDAVVSSVLLLIENLLNLDNQLNDKECTTDEWVIRPHIEMIISCLRDLFHNRKQLKKTLIAPGRTEIGILRLLVKYVENPLAARHFLEIMSPLFKKRLLTYDHCCEGLHVLKGIIPFMDNLTIIEVLKLIRSLLVSSELDVRLIICDILDHISENDSSAQFLAKVIRNLHAMSSSGLNEPDYDIRINTYDQIKPDFFCELKEDHTLVILSHCVYDMSSGDLIFRQCASNSMLSFIQFAASVLNRESSSLGSMFNGSRSWTRSSIAKTIKKIFLPNIGHAMRKETEFQRGWTFILREMVLQLPGISALNSLRPLYNEDPEADFFNNIFHLQIYKRVKALSHFKRVISDGKISEDLSAKIFVPLFFNMIFDVKEGKMEHLRVAYMESLACLCGQMQWHEYFRFLIRCLKEMSLRPDKQKLLLRLICLVLDQFHFSISDSDHIPEQNESGILNSNSIDTKLIMTSKVNCQNSGRNLSYIRETLQKAVLPRILKLVAPDSEKINMNVNLAVLKLLKLLSPETMELHLPGILHHIAIFLKNRLDSIRDEARSALVVCLKELGSEYLQFIVKVMRSVLKRGYELHVLGYTVNFLLSKSLAYSKIGSLDYCLEDLLSIVEEDILGDVSEEKEVDKIASKMKETRNRMSYDTLKLISHNVSFRTQAMKLVYLVNTHLQKHLTMKTKDKIVKMLHHIALGIKSNPSAEQKDVLVFAFGLIEDRGIIDNPNGREQMVTNGYQDERGKMNSMKMSVESSSIGSQWSHIILVFGLEVLSNCLKNMKLDQEDECLVSMLDPFIKLLASCLTSKFEDVLSATFKCLIPLSRLHLPSLSTHANDIKILLIDILQTSTNPNSALVESCIKLLTALLTRISLSNDQLRMLIKFPLFIDLETNPSSMVLSLLKQMVARKLEVPELYDIVLRIAKLMVTSQSEPIRRKCSHILLKFLLDYPLSDKCRQEHVNFLLTNLSYEHASGREAVLEMLNAIMSKFPKRVVETYCQTFFIRLVLALANEKDNKIHSMVLVVLKHLISYSSPDVLRQFVDYSISWYTCENQHLWKASAQVISLLLEVFKDGFEGLVLRILQALRVILQSSLALIGNGVKVPENIEATLLEDAFYSLELFDKLLLHFPELFRDKSLKDLWDAVCMFLLHPYLRLRNISSHLVARYFAAATLDGSKVIFERSSEQLWFLLDPDRLFKLAVSFCIQLMSQPIDDASGNIITQNIVFAICNLHSYAKLQRNVPPQKFWSKLHLHEKNSYVQAFDLLGLKKARNSFLLFSSQEPTKIPEYQDNSIDIQSLLVGSLLKKMGKIAFLKEENQLKVVFNTFRMIASQIGAEDSRAYAIYVVEPLYKVCEGFTGRSISDEVKQFVERIRDSVEKLLGMECYLQAYNAVRKKLKEKREKRRQEEKLMVITDPVRSAKRKLLKSAKNRAHKRRKILGLKMERWKR